MTAPEAGVPMNPRVRALGETVLRVKDPEGIISRSESTRKLVCYDEAIE